MIGSTSEHWIGLNFFTGGIWSVWVGGWDDEIIHFSFKDLFACGVFNIPTGGSSIIIVSLGFIFNTEVGISVKLSSSWSIFISSLKILLCWTNTHWVNQECEVLFQMCWTQHLQLKSANQTLLDKFLKHHFSILVSSADVLLNFFWLKDIVPLVNLARLHLPCMILLFLLLSIVTSWRLVLLLRLLVRWIPKVAS